MEAQASWGAQERRRNIPWGSWIDTSNAKWNRNVHFTFPHFQVQKDPLTAFDAGRRGRGGQRPLRSLKKVLLHLLMKTSFWCRKWSPQWREGDAAYLPQSQNCLDNRVYLSDLVVSYRATILLEHLYHDHCYIQSEKIITRKEQFIGQQNLSILKFHQSIRGLSRDKFTWGKWTCFL